MKRFARGAAPLLAAVLAVNPAMAQRGGNDWMTAAYDAQRSNWVRFDGKISVASMQRKEDGFGLYWKLKPTNTAKQLNSLMPPSLIEFYIGYRGFRSLGFFGASNDRVVGVDTDLGRLEWEKSIGPSANAPAGTPECPGGLTANVTRPTHTAYPPAMQGRGFGRGGPAKSGVGEPHEGAVTLRQQAQPRPAPPKPAPAKPGAPAPVDVFAPRIQYALAISSDGKLHAMWISNGHEANPAVPFIPANANAAGLISYDGTTYVSTLGGCPSAESAVWAMDMTNRNVSKWKASGKGIVGTAGQAAGPDGTVIAATTAEVVSLTPKALELTGSYKAEGAEFTSSPVVFEYQEKSYAAVTSADGRLHVIDLDGMKSLAKSGAILGEGYATGALASWADAAGNRFILAPTANSVVAFQLTGEGGAMSLKKVWASRELMSAAPPVIVNGVVFALSTGEARKGSTAERIKNSKPAVLYALDGADGKELWNSGRTITSFVRSGVMSAGGSRIFLATYEGTEYVFSFPMEH